MAASGARRVKSAWRDGERVREVEVEAIGSGRYRVKVDAAQLEVEAEALGDGWLRIVADGVVTLAEVTAEGARRFIRLGNMDFVLDRETSARRRGAGGGQGALEAPMPGTVSRVMVEAGQEVKQGQPLLAVEAMKMEHLIRAPHAGRVTEVRAKAGEMVAPGRALVALESDGTGEGAKS